MAARTSAYSGDDSQTHEHLFKVVLIGELGTGKTSIIKCYVNNRFPPDKNKITLDFTQKIIKMDDGSVVRLQLWDTASQEKFGNLSRAYYREAVGCIIVFDVTRASTFDAVSKWKTDLDSKVQLPNGNPVPCILLANKCDLAKDGLVNDVEQMNNYCRENGFNKWFETSARENSNINTAIQYLISEIMKHADNARDNGSGRNNGEIKLSETSSNNGSGSGCCG